MVVGMAWCYLMDAHPLLSRHSHLSRRAVLGGLGAMAAGVAGTEFLRGTPAQAATQLPDKRTWADILVPGYGAWLGAYPGPGNAAPTAYESMIGRKLDVVMRYEALDGPWPTPADLALIKAGRWLCVCWSSRLMSNGSSATWADVAAGRYDAAITAQAHRLASVGPIWVGYDNEMDGTARMSRSGPLTNYAAAYRHIQEIVKPIAPNVIWVWCPTGNNMTQAVADCYPGNSHVDWICYDPYDPTLSKGGPLAAYRTFPNWLASEGIGLRKPLGICETGFHRDLDGTPAAAAWMRALPDALDQLNIKLWMWFNSYGGLGDTSMAPGSSAAVMLQSVSTKAVLARPHK